MKKYWLFAARNSRTCITIPFILLVPKNARYTESVKILVPLKPQFCLIFCISDIIIYCRSLIKVKFFTDQVRCALGSGSCSIVDCHHAQKPEDCPIATQYQQLPPYNDPIPPSINHCRPILIQYHQVPTSINQYRLLLTQYHLVASINHYRPILIQYHHI